MFRIQLVALRGKKTAANALTQRVVNQLSALSALKKQPRLIKLLPGDLVKHRTVTNAWAVFVRKQQERRKERLQKQYESIFNAMEELKRVSPDLYEAANKKETLLFPLELRVPVDFPANEPWSTKYSK